ncbi:MAG: hypothetical protein ACI4KG_09805 [Oscillospiraceae bacterium]
MGAWGTGFFQNDTADDLRYYYKAKLKKGKSDEEALMEIIEESKDYIYEDDDKYDFWFGLADLTYDLGRLTNEVKVEALKLIECGGDLERWEGSDRKKRQKQLDKLKEKLLSEPLSRKNIPIVKPFVCPWNVNDVFVYCLNSDEYKGTALYDKYVCILVDEIVNHDVVVPKLGDMLPVVYLKLLDKYPKTNMDIENASFLSRYINSNEYRFMLCRKGFSNFKKRVVYWGQLDFKRADNSKSRYFKNIDFYADVGLHVDRFDEYVLKNTKEIL